jgi:O-acetyl-ADP-ribose deacetylase (regulator of RNase III)
MPARLEVLVARIETLALDAVVNAANRRLLPGTGVDGALRAAAGPELTRRTSVMPPIDVGEAVITPGFNLPSRHIIHTAAPIFTATGEDHEKVSGLSRCYASSLALASKHDLRSIAFPCLGTGNFGWPRELACDVALDTCTNALKSPTSLELVVFCCFGEADAAPYRARLR